jgi:hypothetical protein
MNPTQKQNTEDLTLSYDAPLEMAPEGRHPILCVDVFETWPEEETWDEKTSTKRKIMFVFQVFPDIEEFGEDGSRDSEGDVFRIEHKITYAFTPAWGSNSPSGLWKLAEDWQGVTLSTKNATFNPADMIGKAAWGSLEHKTRYVKLTAIEPYNDGDGNPLPPPKAEPYKRRKYPHPDTWKNKKAEAQTQAQSVSSNLPDFQDESVSDLVPF